MIARPAASPGPGRRQLHVLGLDNLAQPGIGGPQRGHQRGQILPGRLGRQIGHRPPSSGHPDRDQVATLADTRKITACRPAHHGRFNIRRLSSSRFIIPNQTMPSAVSKFRRAHKLTCRPRVHHGA
jgi:hypothetical protein